MGNYATKTQLDAIDVRLAEIEGLKEVSGFKCRQTAIATIQDIDSREGKTFGDSEKMIGAMCACYHNKPLCENLFGFGSEEQQCLPGGVESDACKDWREYSESLFADAGLKLK